MQKKAPLIKYNYHIDAITGMVKVINEAGDFIGEMPLKKALELAFSQNLDLVQISHETMPVCKICDYNKYKYELSKKNKQKNQNNKQSQIKTIKLGINIEKSHLELKTKKAIEFLKEGHKVYFSARLRGREITQSEVAIDFFKEISETFKTNWSIEKQPALMGREVSFVVGKKASNAKGSTGLEDKKNLEEEKNNN